MQLQIINQNGQLLVDSRDVAEMISVRHSDLLEKIDGYVRHLLNGNFRSADFFIESSYRDSTGRKLKCYLLTRKGCDMVANKLTGEKGVQFTAAYVTKFEEMEKQIEQNKVVPLDERRVRMELLKTAIDHEERLEKVETRIQMIEQKVDEQITLDHGEQRALQKAIAKRVYELAADQQAVREFFRQLHREIKDRWAVASYRDVRRNELQQVLNYVDAWMPRRVS